VWREWCGEREWVFLIVGVARVVWRECCGESAVERVVWREWCGESGVESGKGESVVRRVL
jgi:hypothetical protein